MVFWEPAPSRQPLVRGSQPSSAVPVPTSRAPATPFWMCCPGHRVWGLGSCRVADRAGLLWWGWDLGKLNLELIPSFVAKVRRAKLWKLKDLLCAGEPAFLVRNGKVVTTELAGATWWFSAAFSWLWGRKGTNCALLFASGRRRSARWEAALWEVPFLLVQLRVGRDSGYAYHQSRTSLELRMGAPISSWRC